MPLRVRQPAITTPSTTPLSVRVAGVWQPGIVWLRLAGVWQQATKLWIKVNGVWQ